MRLVVNDKGVQFCYARIPLQGFIANVAGGDREVNEKYIEKNKLSKKILGFGTNLNKKLNEYKERIYSIDLVIGKSGKPWLIEMNGKPGIVHKNEQSEKRVIKTQAETLNTMKRMLS